MSFILISEVLTIAVALAFLAMWRRAKKKPLSNVTTVTMIAAVVLLCLWMSHLAMYIKILETLAVVVVWFFAYRFREQGPVVGAVLIGLAAIMILAG